METKDRIETISLVPLGQIDQQFLEKLGLYLEDISPANVQISSPLPIPKKAYNSYREQYNSTAILSYLLTQLTDYDRLLAIAEVDLFAYGFNFVFGEADVLHRISIISLTRLNQEFYDLPEDQNMFFLRTLKEAVHELGHTYGLVHCPNPKCVMHFSNSLFDTDMKSCKFCEMCKSKLT
ncbi:MAG: archaemetzincin family Zn-dependent metalloprotease [Candidatus Marinimicrobia bacterium]|nr:archaemetzincin family Zn-dependent metalloprotease [Candidatus Neomarinimicrobiota bacterium]